MRQAGRDWCQVYNFPTEKTFRISAHGRADASIMAREFVRRGNYYMSLFLQGEPGVNFYYTDAHVHAYPVSVEWREFVYSAGGQSQLRAFEIDELVPTLGSFF